MKLVIPMEELFGTEWEVTEDGDLMLPLNTAVTLRSNLSNLVSELDVYNSRERMAAARASKTNGRKPGRPRKPRRPVQTPTNKGY